MKNILALWINFYNKRDELKKLSNHNKKASQPRFPINVPPKNQAITKIRFPAVEFTITGRDGPSPSCGGWSMHFVMRMFSKHA